MRGLVWAWDQAATSKNEWDMALRSSTVKLCQENHMTANFTANSYKLLFPLFSRSPSITKPHSSLNLLYLHNWTKHLPIAFIVCVLSKKLYGLLWWALATFGVAFTYISFLLRLIGVKTCWIIFIHMTSGHMALPFLASYIYCHVFYVGFAHAAHYSTPSAALFQAKGVPGQWPDTLGW
jgi:hypothetical protein